MRYSMVTHGNVIVGDSMRSGPVTSSRAKGALRACRPPVSRSSSPTVMHPNAPLLHGGAMPTPLIGRTPSVRLNPWNEGPIFTAGPAIPLKFAVDDIPLTLIIDGEFGVELHRLMADVAVHWRGIDRSSWQGIQKPQT